MLSIIADSTCDLSPELVARYDITIIPLHVVLGDRDYLDGISISPDEIYQWSDENKETPKTAALTMGEVEEIYTKELAKADELLVFTISSEMSSSYNICKMVAEGMPDSNRIHIIDSRNLSTGIGLQVLHAAVLAGEGKSAAEIEEEIQAMIPLVRASFVVDTLVYLHRGGRCSGLAMMLGSALKLHPRIAVSQGAMSPGKKYRGSARKYILDYVGDMEADLQKARKDRVFITHSGCDDHILDTVKKYLEDLGRFDEILITRAGSVISSHCGPGTLGVLFVMESE